MSLDTGRIANIDPGPEAIGEWSLLIGRMKTPISFRASELIRLEVGVRMGILMPNINLIINPTASYSELETLEKDDLITLTYKNNTEFERGHLPETKFTWVFQVKDYNVGIDKMSNSAIYGIFGLLKYSDVSPAASSDFYESAKHRYFHGSTSEIIADLFSSHGIKVINDTKTYDIQPNGWIQLMETSNDFCKRLMTHSYISDDDLLLTWVDTDGLGHISSLNKLYSQEKRWNFKSESDSRGTGVVVSQQEVLRKLMLGITENKIPMTKFEYRRQLGLSKLRGVGGTEVIQFDPLNSSVFQHKKLDSISKIGLNGIPFKTAEKKNLAFPYLAYEHGISFSGNLLPAKTTNVDEQYWLSPLKNSSAISHLTNNAISFETVTTGQYKLGDLVTIDLSIRDKQSDFGKNNVFIIYAMTHFKEIDSPTMMTKIWAVSPYVTLGTTDIVSNENNLITDL